MDTFGNRFHVNFLGYVHWFMSIRTSKMKDHSISVDQAKYATSIVAKYLDTEKEQVSTKVYKTTLTADMILTKEYISTSDEQFDKFTREFNINYKGFIVLLIDLLPTRLYLSFTLHKFAKFSANPGKLQFELFVHLLRHIRDSNTLGLKYYSDMNDAPVTDLLRQASIKTENHLIAFSDSSWQDFLDTGRSTGAYVIFYQVGKIYHSTHVPLPVSQSSAESCYNTACTTGMDLAHFIMLIHEVLNKDPYMVPEEAPLIVLDSK